jgi:aspartate aminotransferase-like enzyme
MPGIIKERLFIPGPTPLLMEASVINLLSPCDCVLVGTAGKFVERCLERPPQVLTAWMRPS